MGYVRSSFKVYLYKAVMLYKKSREKVEIPNDPLMSVERSFQLTMEQLRSAGYQATALR
jgi:hypothetical protein